MPPAVRTGSSKGIILGGRCPGARPPIGAILVTKRDEVWSSHGRVLDNVCEGGGITFAGDDGIIAGNRIAGRDMAAASLCKVRPARTL